MPRLSDLLEREGRRVGLEPDSFERLLRRRDRKRRNQRLAAGVVAVAVFVGAMWFLAGRFSDRTPAPASQPSPAGLGSLAYGVDGDIYVADWDGAKPVRIADGRPADDCRGHREYWAEGTIWSPDGRYLAYRHANCQAGDAFGEVVISDPEGNVVASFPSEGWLISWSPDSTRVAVWVRLWQTIGVYGLDGVRQALLTMPPGWKARGDVDPVWLPDGESLLVPRGVVVPIDGSTPRILPADDPRRQWGATYSPDGSRVAYYDGGSLVVAEADGSDAREIVAAQGWNPVWSPTGDGIAFTQRETGSVPTQLGVIDLATGTVTSLAGIGGSELLLVIEFSPEGDRILFSKTEDRGNGVQSLWSIRVDGSEPHRLVRGTGWGDWQSLSQTR